MGEPKKRVVPIPNGLKFVFGGSAGMLATCFVQPLDLLKNRMQMSGEGVKGKEYKSTFHVLASIIQNEGVFNLYNGISAGLLRQATYTTTRLGIYTYLFDVFTFGDKPPNFILKATIAMFAGVCGAFVGTPAEVALIRMTSDGRLPAEQRRNYNHVIDALVRMAREEGIKTWWKGAVPTMGRAMVVNAAQLATYSQAKQYLFSTGHFRDGILLHFCSSMISGYVTSATSMPMDIVKTRMQNSQSVYGIKQRGPVDIFGGIVEKEGVLALWKGFMPYSTTLARLATSVASMPLDIVKTRMQNAKTVSGEKQSGAIQMLGEIVQKEGVFALWKGFLPYYFRIGPHTVLVFVFLEQFNSAYRRFHADDDVER